MAYEIKNIDLNRKLEELSLELPTELTFFPENIETVLSKDQFVFTESVVDLNKLFKQNTINIDVFGGDPELYRSRKDADIYFPAIFFSHLLISTNPAIVTISLNILSNYITDLLKGSFDRKNTYIDFYIETKEKGKIKKLSYKGDAKGLKELNKTIKALK